METLIKEIETSRSILKIITKTKNESLFIEKWIKHHLAIIGNGKLIIFDNMSDDEHVLNIYDKYKESILLFKFKGYPDTIHEYRLLEPFYQAICNSSDFFTIIDSDEYLYLYDEKTNKVIHDSSILDYLKENSDCDFYASCWLPNKEKSENILELPSDFISCFNWGKPIINSRVLERIKVCGSNEAMLRHTAELPNFQYTKAETRFLIAHLKNLNLYQRIATNMNKLYAYGLLSNSLDFKRVVALNDQSTTNKDIQMYIRETQKLIQRVAECAKESVQDRAKGRTLTIAADDSIVASDTFSLHGFCSLMTRSYLDITCYDPSKLSQSSIVYGSYYL